MGLFGKILGALNHFPGTVKSGDYAGFYVNSGFDPAKHPEAKKVTVGTKINDQVLIQKKGDITDPANTLARYDAETISWKMLDDNQHWSLVELHFADGKVSTVQIEKTQSADPTKTAQGAVALFEVLNKGKRI